MGYHISYPRLKKIEELYEEEKKNIILLNLLNKQTKSDGYYTKIKEYSENLSLKRNI